MATAACSRDETWQRILQVCARRPGGEGGSGQPRLPVPAVTALEARRASACTPHDIMWVIYVYTCNRLDDSAIVADEVPHQPAAHLYAHPPRSAPAARRAAVGAGGGGRAGPRHNILQADAAHTLWPRAVALQVIITYWPRHHGMVPATQQQCAAQRMGAATQHKSRLPVVAIKQLTRTCLDRCASQERHFCCRHNPGPRTLAGNMPAAASRSGGAVSGGA